jgi:hypothetical protein
VSNRIVLTIAAGLVAAGLAVQAGSAAAPAKTAVRSHHAARASAHLLVGINDEPDTLYGNPTTAFAALQALRTQVLRVNLYWGGNKWAVANKKPTDPTDPGDPAYNWALYDRLVRYASLSNIKVVFSILFTPSWANGGKAKTVAPTNPTTLADFAHAAAERYSGYWTPPPWQQDASIGNGNTPLPVVTLWTAWNEPNNPIWLTPQYKRIGGKWVVYSAIQYAKICNAVYTGVHSALISPAKGPVPGEQVACGVTGPRGNDAPRSSRPEVDPLSFMVAAKRYGLRTFDVWAHHPYPLRGSDPPGYVPKAVEHAVVLGNIDVLLQKLKQLWGPKHLWLTEYGYQTNPPDRTVFGVTWTRQAAYMLRAYAIARANPRIDMLLWFLVRDERKLGGWQSGLMTATGRLKPSFAAFQTLH